MTDNERAALSQLQEEARQAIKQGESRQSDSSDPHTVLFIAKAALVVLIGLTGALAWVRATDPYFDYRMQVTVAAANADASRIWSLDCTGEPGRAVCRNNPGFGCVKHCTAEEPSTEVQCDLVCSDPVSW